MKEVTISDLEDLALGATVLGSGGGGDPAYELLMAKQQFETHGPVMLVSINDVPDQALVAPVSFMGAPLVGIEKLPSGREFVGILEMLSKLKGRSPTHLLSAEIGGSNAFTPLIVAGATGLPVIDGDTLGRAFPELQMSSCNLKGISPSPAIIGDSLNGVVAVNVPDATKVEQLCRKLTVEMGSSAAVSLYSMSGKEAKDAIIPGSITRAIEIGKALRMDSIDGLLEVTDGSLIGEGMITDIDQSIQEGFLKGTVTIEGLKTFKVFYQNEYLMLMQGEQREAVTPDIIVLLEQNTGKPITSESLSYGIRVQIVVIPGPEIWKSPEGMKMVGPEYFGYNKEVNV